jgi:hypothetical protein
MTPNLLVPAELGWMVGARANLLTRLSVDTLLVAFLP